MWLFLFCLEKSFKISYKIGRVVLNSYLYSKMMAGSIKKILFVATGALLSTVSSGQGESIPCIAHAVVLER